MLREKVDGKSPDVKVCFYERNQGKGAEIRTAIEQVSGDYVIIQDADLEYEPKEYYVLLEPILDGRADVVFGLRRSSSRARECRRWGGESLARRAAHP